MSAFSSIIVLYSCKQSLLWCAKFRFTHFPPRFKHLCNEEPHNQYGDLQAKTACVVWHAQHKRMTSVWTQLDSYEQTAQWIYLDHSLPSQIPGAFRRLVSYESTQWYIWRSWPKHWHNLIGFEYNMLQIDHFCVMLFLIIKMKRTQSSTTYTVYWWFRFLWPTRSVVILYDVYVH